MMRMRLIWFEMKELYCTTSSRDGGGGRLALAFGERIVAWRMAFHVHIYING